MTTGMQVKHKYPPSKTGGKWIGFVMGIVAGCLICAAYGSIRSEAREAFGAYWGLWVKKEIQGFVASLPFATEKADQRIRLRYDLLRYGNDHHFYDEYILRHKLYPKTVTDPAAFVAKKMQYRALYVANPLIETIIVSLLFLAPALLGLLIGMKKNSSYNEKIISPGFHLRGAKEIDMPTYRQYTKGAKGITFVMKPRDAVRNTHWD